MLTQSRLHANDARALAGTGRLDCGGCTGSIGCETGVPSVVLDRCIGRMQAFLVLARAALAAEFPSFESAQAYQVFDLVVPPTQSVADRHLERLSHEVLHLDAVELKAQWQDFLPRAQNVRPTSSRSNNNDAWRTVLELVEQDKRLQAAHPCGQL